MRFLSLILFTGFALGQIPNDTLVTKTFEKLTAHKAYVRDHPDSTLDFMLADAIHMKNADGTRTALLGRGIAHIDSATGQLVPSDLELWQTSTGGYRTVGGTVIARIVDGPSNSTVLELYNAATGRVITLNPNRVSYLGDTQFGFTWGGLAWTITLNDAGFDVSTSAIAASLGSKTYQFPNGGFALTADSATGDLTGADNFRLTRAVMVGADHSQTPCSAWATGSKAISFTCDDSALPPAAFPYIIDPTGTFNGTSGAYADFADVCSASCPVDPSLGQKPTGVFYHTAHQASINRISWGYAWMRNDREPYMRFDTSSLPSTANVLSATLQLSVGTTGWTANHTISIYYYSGTWPLSGTYWNDTAHNVALAYSCTRVSNAACIAQNANNVLTLSNPSSVVKGAGAYTAFRIAHSGFLTDGNFLDINDPWDVGGASIPVMTATYEYAPVIVSGTPTAAGNYQIDGSTWYTFTAVYRDADGYADMIYYRALVAYGVDANGACYVGYYRTTNTVWLANNGGDPFAGVSGTLGSGGVLTSTGYCDLDATNTTKTDSGTDTTINFKLRFKTNWSYGGYAKNYYLHVVDAVGAVGGWSQVNAGVLFANEQPVPSAITVPGAPYVSNVWYNFGFTVTDKNGYADLLYEHISFGTVAGSTITNNCYLSLNTGDAVYLANDAGGWTLHQPWGTAAILSNTQCDVDVQGTTLSQAGNVNTYNVKVRFKPPYIGTIWGWDHAQDAHGAQSAWTNQTAAIVVLGGGTRVIVVSQ